MVTSLSGLYGGLAVALVGLVWACRSDTPPVLASPPPVTPPPLPEPKPDRKPLAVLPFPDKFTLARRDLPHFSASIDLDYPPVKQRGILLQKVRERRFGCYTLDTTARWTPGMNPRCPPGLDCYGHHSFPHGEFVFYPLYPGGAEYPPAIVSVWKVRGDSLDFYAVWDKAFASENWNTGLEVISVTQLSANKRRVTGNLSWENAETRKRVVRPWVAVWTLPHQLTIR